METEIETEVEMGTEIGHATFFVLERGVGHYKVNQRRSDLNFNALAPRRVV